MNLQIDEFDIDELDKLVQLIQTYRIEYFWGTDREVLKIEPASLNLDDGLIDQIHALFLQLNVYWIYSNDSSTFITLGRWSDASWGFAKLQDSKYDSPFRIGKIHEMTKLNSNNWYYFLHE